MKDQASFCISIDCELAWGVHEQISHKFIEKTLELDEKICFDLLSIFNESLNNCKFIYNNISSEKFKALDVNFFSSDSYYEFTKALKLYEKSS